GAWVSDSPSPFTSSNCTAAIFLPPVPAGAREPPSQSTSRCFLLSHRYYNGDSGTVVTGSNLQTSSELAQPLAHAGNSHSQFCIVAKRCFTGTLEHPMSAIRDLQFYFGVSFVEADCCCVTARMAVNIGKTFLNNPEERRFDIR